MSVRVGARVKLLVCMATWCTVSGFQLPGVCSGPRHPKGHRVVALEAMPFVTGSFQGIVVFSAAKRYFSDRAIQHWKDNRPGIIALRTALDKSLIKSSQVGTSEAHARWLPLILMDLRLAMNLFLTDDPQKVCFADRLLKTWPRNDIWSQSLLAFRSELQGALPGAQRREQPVLMPPDEPDYASLDPSSCMRTDGLVGHYMPHAYAYDDEMLASDVES